MDMIRLSVLDYSPIDEGGTAGDALRQTTELARLAERMGYHRFWVAEHHQVFSVAGSSPEMLMMHLAGATETIRIGSGGVMLPHYSAYKVAENFRLLEALHPGRIDLGIGRSRSFRLVNRALNETKGEAVPYEQQIHDLQKYFTDDTASEHRFQQLRATPMTDTVPEMWLLGASQGSAGIAAEAGTGYVYAHFGRPTLSSRAYTADYQKQFRPSTIRKTPNAMIAVFTVVAETKEAAEALAQAFDLWLLFIESDSQPPYYPSVATAAQRGFSAAEREKTARNRKRMLIGTPEQVKRQIEELAAAYGVDEVLVIPNVAGAENRENGIRLLAEAFGPER